MVNVAIYARVSTKDRGQECENQLRELKQFVERKELDGRQILDSRGALEEACRSVGMVDGEKEPTKLFHDLRRTGATTA
jgi:DNA invertase Pin-like site-specific DNA recombinase